MKMITIFCIAVIFIFFFFSCSEKKTVADVGTHPAGWGDRSSEQFHGTVVIDVGNEGCTSCHGSDLQGGESGVSCYNSECHEHYPHPPGITDVNSENFHGQYIKNSPEKDEDYYKIKIVLHRRFSIPIACLTMGLLAFPLGIQSKSTKRSFGLILCVFFFLLYYLLLTAGYAFGEDGSYPPEIGMWLPNVAMGCIGIFFLILTGRERSLKIELIARHIQNLFARIAP